jgi:hypothetical protein
MKFTMRCIKTFRMDDSKTVAFKRGKEYIFEINGEEFVTVYDEQREYHYMCPQYINDYFRIVEVVGE